MNTTRQEVKINTPTTSMYMPPPPPPPPPPKLPRGDLLDEGNREHYNRIAVPLYQASVIGDWEAAEAILGGRPEWVRYAITRNYETALHVAASAEDTSVMVKFVENLVNRMEKEDLELQRDNYNTALGMAAIAGNVKIAQVMLCQNRRLLDIPGNQGMKPLCMAALFGKPDMVKYLYASSYASSRMMTDDEWTREWDLVLKKCVEAELYDVAFKIVMERPELVASGSVLRVLAENPNAFGRKEPNITRRVINSIFAFIHLEVGHAEKDGSALELLKIVWSNILKMPKFHIDIIMRGPRDPYNGDRRPRYSSRILFVAAEMGNTTFVVELIRGNPDLLWKLDDDKHSIFHIAVMRRHQDIYNLLYEIGSEKYLITSLVDKDGNNILHLVGKTSQKMRAETSGASLLMQRELLWFKEVEKMIPPSYRKMKNNDGLTPYELFSMNNEDIVSQGLKWMKDCMVVATLIVTVAFAVAFTVPGGYNQDHGIPIFIHEVTFILFIIADAISLFSSSASLLVFLSILTSRHGQRDFLNSLPTKLMIGLVTLFVSVTAMMVTFSASFFVLYRNGLRWVPILISLFATMPVILFAILQFPLLMDMFRSTNDANYLFNPRKRMLYVRN